jgi:predicted nuclease with TOPRIM domain
VLELDLLNAQLTRRRKMAQLNKISSDVHLLDIQSRNHAFKSSFELELSALRSRSAATISDANARLRGELREHREELQNVIERAAIEEALAEQLADQEREYYERMAEARVSEELHNANAEYRKLKDELNSLTSEQEISKKNKAKMQALKAELDESTQKVPLRTPPISQERIQIGSPQRKPPRRAFL